MSDMETICRGCGNRAPLTGAPCSSCGSPALWLGEEELRVLTRTEVGLLRHTSMFGPEPLIIRYRNGRRWGWDFQDITAPTLYDTKARALAGLESYLRILRAAKARLRTLGIEIIA